MNTQAPSFDNILAQASSLSPADKSRLIAALAAQLAALAGGTEAQMTPARPAVPTRSHTPALAGVGIYPNGLDPDSGQPLLALEPGESFAVPASRDDGLDGQLHRLRVAHDRSVLGLVHGLRDDSLAEARWAIVVSSADSAEIIKALTPLIQHRAHEQGLRLPALDFRAGESCGAWLARHVADVDRPMLPDAAVQVPVLLYHPGEDTPRWLERHGVSARAVDPALGVPFYLLLAGRPAAPGPDDQAAIPFEFQYQLDLFWGVGRLCFTEHSGRHRLNAYTTYAERLVAFEQRSTSPPSRHIIYFGAEQELDAATRASANQLLRPLFQGRPGALSAAERYGFTQELLVGGPATRDGLAAIFHGQRPHGRPALLFSATHGLGFPVDDARLPPYQGALVCQDWDGVGPVRREHWFAGEDLDPQARLDGLIVLMLACYGLGCPREDQFAWQPGRAPRLVAPRPLMTQLPQELLLRGALAVFGHIDRAWSYAFTGQHPKQTADVARAASAQVQAFDDLLRRLLDGKRLGFATDQFNAQQGAVAVELSDRLTQALNTTTPDLQALELRLLWAARNDLRNYAVAGDPAVRLHGV